MNHLLTLCFLQVLAFSSVLATSQADEAISYYADKCTALAVGKKATIDGSTMVTHTMDCKDCDWRVNKVAAKDWPEGSQRPIYLITGNYPRQVRNDRGQTWSTDNLEDMPQKPEWEKMEGTGIIGYIPQVAHTYALIEGGYGIMNEYQVSIGESTCAAKLFAAPVSAGGKALLEASELSQIGLERGRTARETISIMGELAEKYGFYSAEWTNPNMALGEGGEALTVGDIDEVWMFHIVPDDTGASAVWVAQRVPDDHISVVANQFVIREVDPDSPDFMFSSNLWSVAEKMGWYDSKAGKKLDFLRTYAPSRYHPLYCSLRMWRVFSLAGAELPAEGVSPYLDEYPFSVPVTRKEGPFSVQDIIDMQRDHYEGTPYSTTQGLAAGPYGDPNRFDLGANGNMTVAEANKGEFKRTISLFRTSYAFVTQSRRSVPNVLALVWLGQYAPDMSSFAPLYVHSESLPTALIRGTMHAYNNTSAWWNFCVVGNYAARFYSFTIGTIRNMQRDLEKQMSENVKNIEMIVQNFITQDADTQNPDRVLARKLQTFNNTFDVEDVVTTVLTDFTMSQGELIVNTWRDFFPILVTTFRDGYVVKDLDKAVYKVTNMFYPKWWLEAVGFFNSVGNTDGTEIMFASNPTAYLEGSGITGASLLAAMFLVVLTAGVSFYVGMSFGAKQHAVSGCGSGGLNNSVRATFSSISPASFTFSQHSFQPKEQQRQLYDCVPASEVELPTRDPLPAASGSWQRSSSGNGWSYQNA